MKTQPDHDGVTSSTSRPKQPGKGCLVMIAYVGVGIVIVMLVSHLSGFSDCPAQQSSSSQAWVCSPAGRLVLTLALTVVNIWAIMKVRPVLDRLFFGRVPDEAGAPDSVPGLDDAVSSGLPAGLGQRLSVGILQHVAAGQRLRLTGLDRPLWVPPGAARHVPSVGQRVAIVWQAIPGATDLGIALALITPEASHTKNVAAVFFGVSALAMMLALVILMNDPASSSFWPYAVGVLIGLDAAFVALSARASAWLSRATPDWQQS